MPLKVCLAHDTNPDLSERGGYWETPKDAGEARWVEVASLEEATEACAAFIARNELGGGNWTGGEVRDQAGQRLGLVAYNGRFFHEGGESSAPASA